VLEGEAPAARTVVMEFRTREAALDWSRSEEYSEIRMIREGALGRLYVVEGIA